MLASPSTPSRARWAVMWIHSKNGRNKVFRKDFGDDLASAEELFLKAYDAGKAHATLACVNMGFPPPTELRPHTVTKRGRDKRTRKVRKVTVQVEPLKELNMQGKLWCPYCRKLRPFVLKKSAMISGIKLQDSRYVCPICGVSQRDYHVRLWNPSAVIHMDSSVASRSRAPRKTKPRRRLRR